MIAFLVILGTAWISGVIFCIGAAILEIHTRRKLERAGQTIQGKVLDINFYSKYKGVRITFAYGDHYQQKQTVSKHIATHLIPISKEIEVCYLPSEPEVARIAAALSDNQRIRNLLERAASLLTTVLGPALWGGCLLLLAHLGVGAYLNFVGNNAPLIIALVVGSFTLVSFLCLVIFLKIARKLSPLEQ